MYIRKTVDEYQIQGFYTNEWEIVTTEDNFKQAKQRIKEYRENENYAFRIVKKRVKKV